MDMKKLRAAAAQRNEELSGGEGGDFPDWLDINDGEEFIGKITKIRNNTFDDSGKTHMFEVHSIDNEDEVYTLRAHKALVSKVEKQQPEVGSIIYIHNIGKVKSQKSKFKYNDYEVLVITQEEYDDMVEGKTSKKPASKKPSKDEDEADEKPVKKAGAKKPATKKPEDEDEVDPEDKKVLDYVNRALEFNDNEIDIDELVRMCKSKSIKFKDLKEAKAKFVELGFAVSDDGLVSKE